MEKILAGVGAAAFFAAAPAMADERVASCVARVMAERGWTEADMQRLQPQVIPHDPPLTIRSGGTLSSACTEMVAAQVVAENARLMAANEQLARDTLALTEEQRRLNSDIQDLRTQLDRAKLSWLLDPRTIILGAVAFMLLMLVIAILVGLAFGRELNEWSRRMRDQRRYRRLLKQPDLFVQIGSRGWFGSGEGFWKTKRSLRPWKKSK